MDWIIEELAGLKLGDKRLEKRSQKVLGQLSQQATNSIPAACRGAGEAKAAYRLFDNEKVEAKKIQATHFEATLKRMAEHPIILLPQDTTVLNFSTQYERKDTGPTTKETTKGMHLHCAIAVTPEKLCLGAVSTYQWRREVLQNLTKDGRKKKNYSTAIENKESYRWLENYKRANEYAIALPHTTIVTIADREGDIYALYEEAHQFFSTDGVKAHYLIRAKTDRRVCTEKGKNTANKIKSALKSEAPWGQLVVEVSETKKRKAREARMTIYSKAIHIARPYKRKKEKNYQPIKVTAILCVENNPPVGARAIEWLLITDLHVSTFEEACEKIHWYTCRWQIEIFFKILKSGCTIEKLQLTDKNFSVCLSFYIIIAWRILYLVILGRHCPDVSCESVLSQDEWKTAYIVGYKKKPPLIPPRLNEMIRLVASFGGYLNRKKDPEPGVKTLWIGLRNLQEHIRAKEAFEEVYGNTCG